MYMTDRCPLLSMVIGLGRWTKLFQIVLPLMHQPPQAALCVPGSATVAFLDWFGTLLRASQVRYPYSNWVEDCEGRPWGGKRKCCLKPCCLLAGILKFEYRRLKMWIFPRWAIGLRGNKKRVLDNPLASSNRSQHELVRAGGDRWNPTARSPESMQLGNGYQDTLQIFQGTPTNKAHVSHVSRCWIHAAGFSFESALFHTCLPPWHTRRFALVLGGRPSSIPRGRGWGKVWGKLQIGR